MRPLSSQRRRASTSPRQRGQRLLDTASARGAVSAGLVDALEEWNETHPDALLRLPTELVHAIFRLLAFRDRIAVSHISRGWRETALADPFLWNAARFVVDRSRGSLVYYPPPGGRAHENPPPPRKADILRELLARSDPVPFSLAWKNQRPVELPDEMVELVLANMHRMQELAVELSAPAFERLFALPAPALRTLSCTTDSAPCTLPARWAAPVLQKLELGVVHVRAETLPLPSVEVFVCHALHGLARPLHELFPALMSLSIEAATPAVAHSLGDLPPALAELTLWTDDAPAIDYAPLLGAWSGRKLALLRLESVRDAAPVLALFTSAVAGPWAMTIGRKGWRLRLAAEREDVTFDIHLAAPLSFAREPRIGQHLARLSALSADATLLVQMASSACTLPALRGLTLEFTRRPQWPSGPCVPIPAPQLEDVSVLLHAGADGAAHWITDQFPEMLRSRFEYDRPLLARVSIQASSDAAKGLEERSLAGLRALAERVWVEVLGET